MSDFQSLLSRAHGAYSRGDLDAASRALREALAVSPSSVEANVLMGIVCARRGDRPSAIDHLQKALEADAACYEAHVALSTLLFADSRPDLAVEHGEKAIALNPKDFASHHHLARDLIAHRHPARAIPYLRQALQLAPGSPALIQDLATALGEIGQREEAIQLWTRLTQLQPKVLIGWLRLGNLFVAEQRFKEAFVCGRKAILLAPDSADARLLIGLALLGGEGGAAEAEAHLSKAIQLKPEGMLGHSAYGLALQEIGRFEEARPHFEKVIEINPSHGQAYYSLIRSRKATDADRPLLERMTRHLTDPAASPLDRSYMHYALGKAHEDFREYEASMRHFDQATALAAEAWFASRPPDRDGYARMVDTTIKTFSPSFLASPSRAVTDSEKPLLVVGMIRSGTTLVEQILSSHPAVKGAGELPFWHESTPRIFDVPGRRVDESDLRAAADEYLALLNRLGGTHARVIDKMPHNYALLGFVMAAIPRARVIYVKRHPVDNCLSIYTTAYQHPPALTLSRANIVFGYREHERLMAHWRSVLSPSQLLEVCYEDLVENREDVTRRMVKFAGLEWDDACLHHESNTRSVSTPSDWQVRQPIYKTSVARWRNFEPWLGEFKDLLPGS